MFIYSSLLGQEAVVVSWWSPPRAAPRSLPITLPPPLKHRHAPGRRRSFMLTAFVDEDLSWE